MKDNRDYGTSPVLAGRNQATNIKSHGLSLAGYSDSMLRQYFNIDWQYSINQAEALSYGTKSSAFQSWKRGFKES